MAVQRLARPADGVLAAPEELDDAEGEIGEPFRVGCPARHEERVQRRGVRLRRQLVAIRRGEVDDALPALRGADDAAHHREAPRAEEAGDGAVGGDHEVLDQLLGAVLALGRQAAHRVAGEQRLDLDGLQLEGAALVTAGAQQLGDAVLQEQVVGEPCDGGGAGRRPGGAGQPRADLAVGKLRVVVHQRPVDGLAGDVSAGGDSELGHHRRPVLARVQGGQVGAEAVGEHGEGVPRRVDRGRVDAGVGVQGGAGVHGTADVGDRHEDPRPPVAGVLRHRELVEVERVVVVDRAPEEVAQVGGLPVRRRLRREGARLGQRRRREVRLEAELDHGGAGDPQQQRPLCLRLASHGPTASARQASLPGSPPSHVTVRASAGAAVAASSGRR